MKKRYGIDLDGVCFDFTNSFRQWLNDKLSIDIGQEEVTSYYWYEGRDDLSKKEFFEEFDKFGIEGHGYRHLDVLPGTKDALQKIVDAGHDIYYITNRPLYARQDTIDCLEEHEFPFRENLHFAKGAKGPLIKKFAVDVFIDDSPRTLVEVTVDTRATIYCRNYPFNSHIDDTWLTRVDSWDEFIKAEGLNG